MHEAVRKDLITRLQRLTPDERSEVMDAAAGENIAEAGKEAAASAVARYVRPRRDS
jgi:hypothetical protein